MERKISFQKELFIVGELRENLIATAIFGYDGHRGWLYYFAVLPKYQKGGFGKQLLTYGESKLTDLGCPKLNLQIRTENTEAINFYEKEDYKVDPAVSYGKRLIAD